MREQRIFSSLFIRGQPVLYVLVRKAVSELGQHVLLVFAFFLTLDRGHVLRMEENLEL